MGKTANPVKLLDILMSTDQEKVQREDAEFHVKEELYNLQATINSNKRELSKVKREVSQSFLPNKDGSFRTTDWSQLASKYREIEIKEDLISRLEVIESELF